MIIQLLNAVILILTGHIRIFAIKEYNQESRAFSGFTLSAYLILFGVMIILVEFTIMRARAWFYFLNFTWGKSLFSLFIAVLVLGSGRSVRWLDVLMAFWFIPISILFLLMYFAYRTTESAQVEILIKQMEEKIEAKNKKASGQSNKKYRKPRKKGHWGGFGGTSFGGGVGGFGDGGFGDGGGDGGCGGGDGGCGGGDGGC